MADKCFCHLNGYQVKDAVARKQLEQIITSGAGSVCQLNGNKPMYFWVGTQAEYNELETVQDNCFYIITDDPTFDNLQAEINLLQEALKGSQNDIEKLDGKIDDRVDDLIEDLEKNKNVVGGDLYLFTQYSEDDVSGRSGVIVSTQGDGETQTAGYLLPWGDGQTNTHSIGSASNQWDNAHIKKLNAKEIHTDNIEVNNDGKNLYLFTQYSDGSVSGRSGVIVSTQNDSDVQTAGYLLPWGDGYTNVHCLGSSPNPWTKVFSQNGIIQTSSRDAKENIKNVISELTPVTMTLDNELVEISDITAEMLVDFVRNLQPVTFNYKGDKNPDSEQIGLIADDISEHPVYKYIGIDYVDETENKRIMGLQALPLTVTALTTCKYLLNQLDNVYSVNEELQNQLDDINTRLSALEGK